MGDTHDPKSHNNQTQAVCAPTTGVQSYVVRNMSTDSVYDNSYRAYTDCTSKWYWKALLILDAAASLAWD